jgi:undecaprenyl-diphosphatase
MNLIQALILSVIEGITEFLPISSTGHMILTANLLKITETDFVKSFEIIIQLGAILAVAIIYFRKLLNQRILWPKLAVAFLPTAIIGFTLYKVIKNILLGNAWIVVISLFIGGIILILSDKFLKNKEVSTGSLSYKQAFIIGLCQSVSIIPGVSRSAASIIGGLLVGLNRNDAVEFSFMLAIPTMIAATGLDLIKSSHNFSITQYEILTVGLIGAFITALIAVKTFLKYVKNHNFSAFGVYRIILALTYWVFILR